MKLPCSPLRSFPRVRTSNTARCTLLLALLTLALSSRIVAQGLQITYGNKGVQTLSFNGTTLEDINAFPSDAFHIWHMKATDLGGNVLTAAQYGWGENNTGESWNPQTQTETYSFNWGTLATQFAQRGNNLDITVTETNYASSGILFDGAEIFPFLLHFPQDPANFNGYSQLALTTTGPGVTIADYGSGVVTAVLPNETLPLYTGWKNQGVATYSPVMTSTAPDYLATFFPHIDYPVKPGTSFTFTVSLRFTPEGTAADATDAYASFAAMYPSQMTWTDRRILGTAYLASSPSGADITQPGGFPTNPRRYFNDPSVDITTPAGLQQFQDRVLTQVANDVINARNMNAQGVITWDLEGEQYPQSTSYVCSPDQVAAVAPEMESTITDTGSPFYGQKLDDAYFKTLSNAGLRVGLCLRPQMFTLGPNNTASQITLTTNAAIIANLEKKARYANVRWGATVFYVDSTVDANGGTLDPAIFQQLITDLPTFLFIPEESTPRYYAYSAPFYSFLDLGSLGTAASIYNVYPHAFGANLVNDAPADLLAKYTPQLTQSVEHGDILMGHVGYWDANDPTLVAIYRAAGAGAPASPTTPVINWPAPAPIIYGTPLSSAQLDATASVPGTFSYSPAAGAVLPAGSNTLSVTFTPSDTADFTTATATVQLTVTASTTPVITWPTPAAITYGTPLSSLQLDASANVPGTFAYSPANGAVLGAGNQTLTAVFTPSAEGAAPVTATRSLLVSKATPQITWPTPAPITYGTALSSAQLNAGANVPGSFAYTPTAGTVLNPGSNTLAVTFTPSDLADYTVQSASVTLLVNPATTSPAPVAILSPADGSTVSGTVLITGQVGAPLDAAGSYLIVDGLEVGTHRVTERPYLYPLDTTTLSNGAHTLQLWAHTINNDTVLSAPIVIVVQN